MDTYTVGEPLDRKNFSFYLFILSWSLSLITYLIIYHGHFYTYFCLHFTPLWFIFLEGESVRIPATSYLVALFTRSFFTFYCHITWMYLAIQPIVRDIVQLGLKGIGSFT